MGYDSHQQATQFGAGEELLNGFWGHNSALHPDIEPFAWINSYFGICSSRSHSEGGYTPFVAPQRNLGDEHAPTDDSDWYHQRIIFK